MLRGEGEQDIGSSEPFHFTSHTTQPFVCSATVKYSVPEEYFLDSTLLSFPSFLLGKGSLWGLTLRAVLGISWQDGVFCPLHLLSNSSKVIFCTFFKYGWYTGVMISSKSVSKFGGDFWVSGVTCFHWGWYLWELPVYYFLPFSLALQPDSLFYCLPICLCVITWVLLMSFGWLAGLGPSSSFSAEWMLGFWNFPQPYVWDFFTVKHWINSRSPFVVLLPPCPWLLTVILPIYLDQIRKGTTI